MSLKQHLNEMDKSSRQAFLELERMIIKSKIETLAAIPPNHPYNDTEIKNKLESIESKMNNLDFLIRTRVEEFKTETGYMQNAHNNLFASIGMVDDYLTLFDILTTILTKIINQHNFDEENNRLLKKCRDISKNIIKQQNMQNKTYEIYIENAKDDEEIV